MNKLISFAIAVCLSISATPGQALKGFEFQIETLGGRKLTQDDFKNNVVILDFWGTWCGPCRQAVPGLVNLYAKYKHHGLEIIGLNYREKGTPGEVRVKIREFAAANGITYNLAVGTPEIRKQVIGFSGYPTMLFFKKGMKFDHLEVGFAEDHVAKMEEWVRKELGFDSPVGADPVKVANPAKVKGEGGDKPPVAEKIKVPAGVIYRPGNHDTGFDFTVAGLDGKEIKFEDYRGKRVILVLTSTWDQEAASTAKILAELHQKYGDKSAVLAASLEMKKDSGARAEAIRAFVKEHDLSYTVLPVGLSFLKKIHEPSGIPLFLVFDDKGTLILRKRNDTKERVLKAIEQVMTG